MLIVIYNVRAIKVLSAVIALKPSKRELTLLAFILLYCSKSGTRNLHV